MNRKSTWYSGLTKISKKPVDIYSNNIKNIGPEPDRQFNGTKRQELIQIKRQS
jgi:hypothetical protein